MTLGCLEGLEASKSGKSLNMETDGVRCSVCLVFRSRQERRRRLNMALQWIKESIVQRAQRRALKVVVQPSGWINYIGPFFLLFLAMASNPIAMASNLLEDSVS